MCCHSYSFLSSCQSSTKIPLLKQSSPVCSCQDEDCISVGMLLASEGFPVGSRRLCIISVARCFPLSFSLWLPSLFLSASPHLLPTPSPLPLSLPPPSFPPSSLSPSPLPHPFLSPPSPLPLSLPPPSPLPLTVNEGEAVVVPRHLLVFINPVGGPGKGISEFKQHVQPMFDMAEINYNVIVTGKVYKACTWAWFY